jgi:hypothetical protein
LKAKALRLLEINGRQHYPPKLLPSRTALVSLPTFDNLVFCDWPGPTIFGGMQHVNSAMVSWARYRAMRCSPFQ